MEILKTQKSGAGSAGFQSKNIQDTAGNNGKSRVKQATVQGDAQ
jgi:hypothetical protein